jgi:hypothetical protein
MACLERGLIFFRQGFAA